MIELVSCRQRLTLTDAGSYDSWSGRTFLHDYAVWLGDSREVEYKIGRCSLEKHPRKHNTVITHSHLYAAWRGLGYGRRLYLELIAEGRRHGYRIVSSRTMTHNGMNQMSAAARRVWESLMDGAEYEIEYNERSYRYEVLT